MGTRILILVLFVLSVLTSSALTYLLINKTGSAGGAGNVAGAVEKFITENPEVIIQGLRKAQESRAQQEAQDSEKMAMTLRPQLEKNPTDGQAGNKSGDVTMVAFYDHNCGYCRKSVADIEKVLGEDKDLKLVVKEFPILGPLSVDKAKASIAVAKIAPDKWYDYYDGMAHTNTQTVEQVVEFVQTKLGIDPNLLRSEMESKETANKISENHALGEQLNISGTPVFIINGKVIRGAAGYDAFKAAIAEARADNKS
jgi:protein-disulfide isomerase